MPALNQPEVWMRGPIPEILPLLQPVAHSLLQSLEEVRAVVGPLSAADLWARPGGVSRPSCGRQPGPAVHLCARRRALGGAKGLSRRRGDSWISASAGRRARVGLRAAGGASPQAASHYARVDVARSPWSRAAPVAFDGAWIALPRRRAHAATRWAGCHDREDRAGTRVIAGMPVETLPALNANACWPWQAGRHRGGDDRWVIESLWRGETWPRRFIQKELRRPRIGFFEPV